MQRTHRSMPSGLRATVYAGRAGGRSFENTVPKNPTVGILSFARAHSSKRANHASISLLKRAVRFRLIFKLGGAGCHKAAAFARVSAAPLPNAMVRGHIPGMARALPAE